VGTSNIHYDNMLYAQIDSVYSALSTLDYSTLEVDFFDTEWPSKGESYEFDAMSENTQIYKGNPLHILAYNQGPPMRPFLRLETYVFSLFNEDLNTDSTSERNYRLFKYYRSPSPTYDVGLHGSLSGN